LGRMGVDHSCRISCQVLRERHGAHRKALCQTSVHRVKKRATVVSVSTPRVLTIQDHGDYAILIATEAVRESIFDFVEKGRRGGPGIVDVLVAKADSVRKVRVTKEYCHFLPFLA